MVVQFSRSIFWSSRISARCPNIYFLASEMDFNKMCNLWDWSWHLSGVYHGWAASRYFLFYCQEFGPKDGGTSRYLQNTTLYFFTFFAKFMSRFNKVQLSQLATINFCFVSLAYFGRFCSPITIDPPLLESHSSRAECCYFLIHDLCSFYFMEFQQSIFFF